MSSSQGRTLRGELVLAEQRAYGRILRDDAGRHCAQDLREGDLVRVVCRRWGQGLRAACPTTSNATKSPPRLPTAAGTRDQVPRTSPSSVTREGALAVRAANLLRGSRRSLPLTPLLLISRHCRPEERRGGGDGRVLCVRQRITQRRGPGCLGARRAVRGLLGLDVRGLTASTRASKRTPRRTKGPVR